MNSAPQMILSISFDLLLNQRSEVLLPNGANACINHFYNHVIQHVNFHALQ